MSTITITTTQNIDLEYDLASVGERMVAWLIDAAIFVAYFMLLNIVLGAMGAAIFIEKNPWISFFLTMPFVFYNLLCDMGLNGQTVGKRVMKIKVVSLNGEQATIGQYMLRWLFRMVDIFIFGLPAFISIIVSQKNQRLGDMVAGTTLIRTVPRSAFQQTIYMPTPETNYIVSFPEVANLSDKDMQLVKDVIMNVNRSGNSVLAYQAAEKIKHTLHIQTNLEPLYFLQVLLSDYNHLTSRL